MQLWLVLRVPGQCLDNIGLMQSKGHVWGNFSGSCGCCWSQDVKSGHLKARQSISNRIFFIWCVYSRNAKVTAVGQYLAFAAMYNIPREAIGLPLHTEDTFISFIRIITHCKIWLPYDTIITTSVHATPFSANSASQCMPWSSYSGPGDPESPLYGQAD